MKAVRTIIMKANTVELFPRINPAKLSENHGIFPKDILLNFLHQKSTEQT